MKIIGLSMGEKQPILKLRKDGKLIRGIAETLFRANTTIWNVLKKRETTDVLSNRHQTGQPKKTDETDERIIVPNVKKTQINAQ